MKFHIDSPMLKYRQNASNSCRLIRLNPAFESINKIKSTNDISKRIEASLTSQVSFRYFIDSENDVLKIQKIVKGKQKLYYNMKKYTHKGSFNILNNISEHITLVQ